MASCPPIRGHWHSSRSPEVAQFLQRTVQATPLFMADAFAPALLLYHPPRGLRDNGLVGNCNRSARSVSRTGECDMLRLARALVRNATHPTTAARFGRCAVVGSGSQLDASKLGACIDGHDAVIRLNDAPVAPQYADDVGQRTTWRLSTMQSWVDAVKVCPNATAQCTHLLFARLVWPTVAATHPGTAS